MRELNRAAPCAAALAAGLAVLFLQAGTTAQNSSGPRYKFDPDFPRPLPNKWKIGGVMGISIMADDSIWVYNRPNDLTNLELGAETTPPLAECCVRPPSMIHFDSTAMSSDRSWPRRATGWTPTAKASRTWGRTPSGSTT